MTEPSNSIR